MKTTLFPMSIRARISHRLNKRKRSPDFLHGCCMISSSRKLASENSERRDSVKHRTLPSDSTDTNPLVHAWPQLVSAFQDQSNEQGRFPLFPENVMKRVTMDRKRKAAVLVLLCSVKGQPSLLFTKRSSRLSQHAAEISFPGGHYESDTDETLVDTALREAMEELDPAPSKTKNTSSLRSLDKEQLFARDNSPVLRIIGQAMTIPALRGTPVTPVIAGWMNDFSSHESVAEYFPGDPGEVDKVFTVPLQSLFALETTRRLPQNRFGVTQGPVFPTDHGNVWGLTAYIVRPLLHNLLRPIFNLRKSA